MTRLRPQIHNGLHWVRGELDQSLSRARNLIEGYAESPKDMLPLQQAYVELHQVRGTASMIQCFGISAAAEEMKQAVHDLMNGKLAEREMAFSVLLGATAQLTDYIEAIDSGMDDCAMILQPMINELRLVRGKGVLTECDLFVAQLHSLNLALPTPDADTRLPGAARAQAKKLLLLFQRSLLQWLRGAEDGLASVARMGRIGEQIALHTRSTPLYLLWRCFSACSEALLARALDESLDLKRLFGAAGRQIMLLADQDEAAAASQLGDLAYQFLFQVGRSRGTGPRVAGLRKVFSLSVYLPETAELDHLRRRMRGPNVSLLTKVAEEIRVDLGQVKDMVDLAVRAGPGPNTLKDTRGRLKRIGDTLGVLGLPALNEVIGEQAEILGAIPEGQMVSPDVWMELATAILRVENSLESALFRTLIRQGVERNPTELEVLTPAPRDVRDGRLALLREALVSLARGKAGVDAFVRSGDASGLGEAAQMLTEIAAVLDVLGIERAARLTRHIELYLRSDNHVELRESVPLANRFADVVARLEYYLESLRDELPEVDRQLEDLEQDAAAYAGAAEAVIDLAAFDEPSLESEAEVIPVTAPEPVAAPAPAAPTVMEAVDPEIIEVFVEEAGEVRAVLDAALPRWLRDVGEKAVLTDIRRAFHTLKGSGRMVGAADIGEFGWSLESMLNRVLEGAIVASQPVAETVQQAVKLLPGLIAAFKDGQPADASVAALCARANMLAAGLSGTEADPEMMSVFREDANERLQQIGDWLLEQDRAASDFAIGEEVVRSFHTLRGSAALVKANAVHELAGQTEAYLHAVLEAKIRLPASGLDLISGVHQVLQEWVALTGSAASAQIDASPWLERVAAAQAELPQQATDAVSDRQLNEIFAGEAFELVQKLEEASSAWAAAPASPQPPNELKLAAQTLRGAAQMSNCPQLADAAVALHDRVDEALTQSAIPDADFFRQLAVVYEGMYQFLDSYRDSSLPDNTGDLAQRVAAVEFSTETPPAAPVEVVEAGAAGTATAQAIEMMPVLDDLPPLPEPLPEAPITLTAEEAPLEAASEEETDPELMEIFLAEAQELMGSFDTYSAAWELHPDADEPPAGLKRVVHTLKGSARMAGLQDLGNLAQRLEKEIVEVSRSGKLPTAAFHARLHHVADGLHQALDQLSAGQKADFSPLFAELESPLPEFAAELAVESPAAPVVEELVRMEPSATESASLDFSFDEMVAAAPPVVDAEAAIEMMPVDAGEPVAEEPVVIEMTAPEPAPQPELESVPEAIPEPEPQPAPEPEPVLEAMPSVESSPTPEPIAAPAQAVFQMPELSRAAPTEVAPAMDAELVETFRGEATELIEALTHAMDAWQSHPHNDAAVREVQRVLHTLKGGARMSGLMAMGSAAHHMEERIERLEQRNGVADGELFAGLRGDLDQLLAMQDLLLRGDIEPLADEQFQPAAAELEAPVVVEPEVQEAAPVVETAEAAEIQTVPAAAVQTTDYGAWDPALFWKPEQVSASVLAMRRETARVPVEQLDSLLNQAGEISIYRSRLEEHNTGIGAQLSEMGSAIRRVREQLRLMDIETDAQIAARGLGAKEDRHRYEAEFDPLEMDRYTRMQELSRALSESLGDIANLRQQMDELVSEAETLLLQQSRINTEVQQGLMSTLMVPFSRQAARLQRVVKQTADLEGKQAEVAFEGIDSELDRNVLERMTAPLEHLLRNSIVHGIETPAVRAAVGKAEQGTVSLSLRREGTQLLIELADDGRGLDLKAIREQAIRRGLLAADAQVADEALAQFIFEPGFSTAKALTQTAGRGIGMDVVASEVKQLGGTLELGSQAGKGARFLIRLPLNLAMSQTLLVQVGEEQYAVPLSSIEGIARIPVARLAQHYADDGPLFEYGGNGYRVRYLGDFVGVPREHDAEQKSVSAILVRVSEGLGGQERRVAVVVNQLLGNREIVTKPVGPQVSSVPGVTGATILANGRVLLILDLQALTADRIRRAGVTLLPGAEPVMPEAVPVVEEAVSNLIMVVDDSITIRRVTERLLVKNGFRVVTAKDGLDAMAQLQTAHPAAILLDIEMPRADGFEVAAFVRNTDRITAVPILMITSRSGEKHRERARSLGVNRYMIKPYQEDQLMSELRAVLASPVDVEI